MDLVLTTAHYLMPDAIYKVAEFDAAHRPNLLDTARVAQPPQFDLKIMLAHRATPDVVPLKLVAQLPSRFAPASMTQAEKSRRGIASPPRASALPRGASLVATAKPVSLQCRLVDPTSMGERAGLSACTGDSGAPIFGVAAGRLTNIGIASWSMAPNTSAGCGGLIGSTPIACYRDWITETARAVGSPLP